MKRLGWALLAGSLILAWSAAPAVAAQSTGGEAGERTIQMTARKYKFTPSAITVKQGERVKLVITALDRDHGFALKEYGIKQKLKKGVPTDVEFTADKPGTFTFKCSEFCGIGHPHMKGKLVVEPAG